MNKIIKSALEWAEQLVGIVETPKNSNRGPLIDELQKSFGYIGVQYCALFAQYAYKRACTDLNIPFPFSGTASSQTLYGEALNKNWVETDFSKLRSGDIIIWRKLKLYQGHVGLVKSVDFATQSFITIEGNTSSSDKGRQRDGGGIFERVRYMKKQDFTVDTFYLRGFLSMSRVFPEPLNNKKKIGSNKKDIAAIEKLAEPKPLLKPLLKRLP
jgi:hypothetical protein